MKKPCHKKSKVIFHLLLLVVTCYLWFGNVLFFSLSGKSQRKLSLNLGNGACKWTPPEYDIPENIDFYKTLIAGFPSGDKRLTFVQMEALTGWAAKDEWDFEYLGMSNHPFIKANYPHHEGIWGWDGAADQVVMVVRNLRRSLVEYHDILWDIGYAKTWEEASLNLLNLYRERPPLEDFLEWRDLRVMDEIHWYGWFIDYWMEGGLMRDIFSHKLTTPEHWYLLMQPTAYSKDESAYDRIVGEGVVITEKSYDPPCGTEHKISGGCRPVQIISAERLVKAETGPAEGRKIAMTLTNHTGISEYLIEEEAWQCIWTELIINKKGLKTFIDRDGIGERNYNFSPEMLEEMLHELDRLIAKYGSWHSHEPISEQLVDLLLEHRFIIQNELDELLNSPNLRELKDSDFLGPKERAKRKRARLEKEIAERFAGMSMSSSSMEEEKERHLFHVMKSEDEKKQNYAEFYREIEKKLLENRRAKVKSEVFEEEDRRRRKKRKLMKDDSAVTTPDQDE